MLFALLTYAIVVSLLIPGGFLLMGPVRERRGVLGFTYLAVVVLGWCASLSLAFLSPMATAGAASVLATLGLVVAGFTLRDELLLARVDARLGSSVEREAALDELRVRIVEIGNEGDRVIALMEVTGFPLRRLLLRGFYDDALELLDYIEQRLGPRLGTDDAGEAKLLRARCLLHLGRVDEAERLLKDPQTTHAIYPEEGQVLRALLSASGGRIEQAKATLAEASIGRWATWSYPVSLLVSAHIDADRGDLEAALRRLRSIPESAREAMLQLARAVPGPATEVASRIERPTSPYR